MSSFVSIIRGTGFKDIRIDDSRHPGKGNDSATDGKNSFKKRLGFKSQKDKVEVDPVDVRQAYADTVIKPVQYNFEDPIAELDQILSEDEPA